MKKTVTITAGWFACLFSFSVLAAGEDDHSHNQRHDKAQDTAGQEQHSQALMLSPKQRQLAAIRVQQVSQQQFSLASQATATLKVDRDRTVTLAPQLEVRVLKRHVVPGQEVVAGQALLTLGGAAVAQAQADYIKAAAEWDRIRRMSQSTVSESERLQAQVDAEFARATLEALKMTPKQINNLQSSPAAIGRYQLLAPIAGRVQQDMAMLGQLVAAGTALMQLTDESHLWVEAQLTPQQAQRVNLGDSALVKVGEFSREARIIGRSHELDLMTRTESILLALANPGHELHAGEFAEIYLHDPSVAGVVLPDAALTRGADGDWQVFVEDEDGFEAVEVEVIERQHGLSLVLGLEPEMKVVISGAFFLASELAKSGFDIHSH
ncbi:efflux RND transporter periplasmic adaptor subunit [Shewanella sp. AS1]|uniref:efflux RND transporter periplasmic adaptor subunit n=1 Tax=Shewanella sp. AS1 TaxID=2907626 RepID=UPI001F1C9852|nr:efflux RND transporter periplasmic adaptor subunit [Shewanella sp. AS1]MCE9679944.1 efflux RND transporter periplasmic adaptor subunit [Shewanella sp. AS1]